MDVGVVPAIEVLQRVEYGGRLLRRSCAVEVDEWRVVHATLEDRKVAPEAHHVEVGHAPCYHVLGTIPT